jgi:TatD DNase family protein
MLIDAHAHLDKYSDEELARVLSELSRGRFFTWAVSMDAPSYRRTLDIASQSRWVLPTFGVHPRRAPEYAGNLSTLGPSIERSPALGEIGLDFHWVKEREQYPAQLKVLEYFLAAAREQDKVVNLHTKGAEQETLELLERYAIRRAIVHWYSGPADILRGLIDFGAYFTFGVELPLSEKIRDLARAVPLKQILTETDNPGGLKWLTGELGTPESLLRVVDALAAVKRSEPDAIEQVVEDNFRNLMGSELLSTGAED